MNIEIMRNTLYKAYLDDFARFCDKLGGTTSEVMGDLLSFEVGDRLHPSRPLACAYKIAQTACEPENPAMATLVTSVQGFTGR